MRLRIACHTDRIDEVVAFYRDRVGLREVGRFDGHDGYDGVFLEVPGTGTHLELTTGGIHPALEPHPESVLALYFETQEALLEATVRMAQSTVETVNPYWRKNARAYEDPDGFLVLLALAA